MHPVLYLLSKQDWQQYLHLCARAELHHDMDVGCFLDKPAMGQLRAICTCAYACTITLSLT